MLINCPECGRVVSDAASNCPICAYPLQEFPQPVNSKTTGTTFQLVAIGMVAIASLTPKPLSLVPSLVVVILGIISLIKREPRKYLSIVSIVAGVIFVIGVTVSFGPNRISYYYEDYFIKIAGFIQGQYSNQEIGLKDSKYISKINLVEWEWKLSAPGYSFIKGTVKNSAEKTVCYLKITAQYMDGYGKVLDSGNTVSTKEILPGTTQSFEIEHKHSSKFKKVTIIISEVKTR